MRVGVGVSVKGSDGIMIETTRAKRARSKEFGLIFRFGIAAAAGVGLERGGGGQ